MPVTNPCCCGCSLRTGTQIVAIVNIVLESIVCLFLFLGVFGFGVIAIVGTENMRESDPDNYDRKYGQFADKTMVTVLLVITIISLLVVTFNLISSIVLLIGANQRHHGKCRFWFIVTVIFLILYTIRSIYEVVSGAQIGGFPLAVWYIFTFLVGFAITAYQLWVVHAFMEELKEGGPVVTAGYVHGSGAPAQAYIYTKPGDGPGNVPPPYSQTQEGYVPVPLNNPHGPGYGYPSGPAYPPAGYPGGAAPYPTQSFYPKLDAEKGQNY